ncbi:MAG: FHA domain-containing protein [Planktothrix sp. GU0601_MAG3]|nr:MAG: FHA domain-containing protein [Planktothrix sp. GU0601_MAG3]
MTINCPACSYENPSDAEFCDACGYELGGASVSVAPTIVQSPEPILPAPAPTNGTFTPPAPPTFPSFPTAPTSIPSAATARLISKQPSSPTSEFPLDGSNAIIGKFDPDMGPVDIDLEGFSGDETISRNHAEIYQEGGAWKIKDLGSTNGVFIKQVGQSKFAARITMPEILNNGDEIAIAKIRFLFQTP